MVGLTDRAGHDLKVFKGRNIQIKQTNSPTSPVGGKWLGMAVFGRKLAIEVSQLSRKTNRYEDPFQRCDERIGFSQTLSYFSISKFVRYHVSVVQF